MRSQCSERIGTVEILFKGIPFFVDYLMQQRIVEEQGVVLFNPYLVRGVREIRGFIHFQSPKVIVRAQLGFELVYFKTTVQHLN